MKTKKEGSNTKQYNLVGPDGMWIRHVASSFNIKLNHLSFDFRLFKNPHIDHGGIKEL